MMAQRIDQQGLLLRDLLHGLVDTSTIPVRVITNISLDSREIEPGGLFVAMQGTQQHGMHYLQQALERGAVAVVAEPGEGWPVSAISQAGRHSRTPIILVEDLSQRAGLIAGRFFGHPANAMRVLGVTGTNGKTSVANFIAQALDSRIACGVIGTLGNGLVGDLVAATHTTPDAVDLQSELARLLSLGAKAVAMEVSSHALDQGRVAGLPFHTAVFTNLSRDHQDYHGSMEAYAQAKAKLFHRQGLMLAVVNSDDTMGRQLLRSIGGRTRTVAVGSTDDTPEQADQYVLMRSVDSGPDGLVIAFDSSWGVGRLRSPLIGHFNAENLMLALAVLLAWDMSPDRVVNALERVVPVAGRMSHFHCPNGAQVVVDFAHTPDALRKALQAVREHASGDVFCVFGCGGDRDRGKRPQMGAIAEQHADLVWLTDDNPRSEDPEAIVADVLAGVEDSLAVQVIHDRASAIREAISTAGGNDIVLIAGKGHESYQQVGDLKLPFSDLDQVQQVLQELDR